MTGFSLREDLHHINQYEKNETLAIPVDEAVFVGGREDRQNGAVGNAEQPKAAPSERVGREANSTNDVINHKATPVEPAAVAVAHAVLAAVKEKQFVARLVQERNEAMKFSSIAASPVNADNALERSNER